jgi:hypothetical protein
MRHLIGALRLLALVLAFVLALATVAFADGSHDRTQFGHNITVGPDENVSEITCFGCSVRIRGHVDGDVTTFGGSIVLEDGAEVSGDTTSFAGEIRLDEGVKVDGDVTAFAGNIRRAPSASVGGDVTNMGGPGWILLIFVLPLVLFAAFVAFIIWLIRRLLQPSVPAAA